MNASSFPLLEVRGLDTRFDTPEGEVHAVRGVSFDIAEGESIGIVGESGSGKSQVFLSVMGLLARNGRATGSVGFRGQEILGLPAKALNRMADRGVHLPVWCALDANSVAPGTCPAEEVILTTTIPPTRPSRAGKHVQAMDPLPPSPDHPSKTVCKTALSRKGPPLTSRPTIRATAASREDHD